jgi:hypothetical protein
MTQGYRDGIDETTAAGLLNEPLTWEALADGRVHRLKRGKHFRGDLRAFATSAALEAERLGKAVRTMRDEFGKLQYIWIQFADYQIPVGVPCPRCEATELLRIHEFYGRCPRCSATFIFHGVLGEPGLAPAARGPRADLGLYTDVRLRFLDRENGVERWSGHGTINDFRMLLIVEYPLDANGSRIEDDRHPGEFQHLIHRFPLDPFADALDFDAVFAEQESHPGSAPPGDV